MEGIGQDDMSEHYFTEEPTSKIQELPFDVDVRGQKLHFVSVSGVFSFEPRIDKASSLLIRSFEPNRSDGTLLDIGCGFGAIGLCIKTSYPGLFVTLTDINRRAVQYARDNAERNHLHVETVQGDLYAGMESCRFHDIVSNPPLAAGKSVNLRLIRQAADHLEPGGSLWLTAFHNKGGESLKNAMAETFGNVKDVEKSGGIRVYRSTFG